MSLVILEGPDGVGKTTLGLKLASILTGFAYYRRRVRVSIRDETIESLIREATILDRSWMTDLIYSEIGSRAPGCSRSDLYRFGLLAARRCALHLTLIGNSGSPSQLETHYKMRQDHWSLPATSMVLDPKPSDDEIREDILPAIARGANMVANCPSKGMGSCTPCPTLVIGSYCDLMGDILWCSGIRPREVHIIDLFDWTHYEDEITEFFKPTTVLDFRKGLEVSRAEYTIAQIHDQVFGKDALAMPLERINLT